MSPRTDPRLWALPEFARRVIAALAPVVCPPELESLGLTQAIVDHVEGSIRALEGALRVGLVTGMRTYDVVALVRFGRRAGDLEGARALRHFESWLATPGPTHELAKGLKGLICLAYYEMPEVMRALDYRPDEWIATVDARRRVRYAADIERHAHSLYAPDPLPAGLFDSSSGPESDPVPGGVSGSVLGLVIADDSEMP